MNLVALEQVASVNPKDAVALKNLPDQEIAFLPMDAVSEAGRLKYQEKRGISSVLKGYTTFKRGDVLLAKITPCMENGKAVYLEGLDTEYGAGSTEFHVLRPSEEIDGRYLFFLIWNSRFRHIAQRRMTGSAGQKRVPTHFMRSLKIPLPSLEEQRRIAAILDKANAIRRKRQKALTLADDFLRATFLDMFGDPVVNPKGWDVKCLGEILDGKKGIVDGPFGSAIDTKVDYIENGDIPVIRTKNVGRFEFKSDDLKWIRRGKFEEIKRSAVYPGDIVLTKVGTIGNVCRFPSTYPEAVLSTTGSCRIKVRNDLATDDYLLFYLDLYKPQMMRIASTAVQPFLNLTQIKGFEVPMPPLDLQQKFSSLFVSSQKHSEILSAAEHQALSMFNSISQLAFRGEL